MPLLLVLIGAAVLIPVTGRSRSLASTEPVSYFGPSWSPDGKRLAFAEFGKGRPVSLIVANADGTASRAVATAPYIGATRWAPRGNVIAYSWAPWRLGFEQPPYSLAVVQIGAPPRTLAIGLGAAWAPDARRLVFVREVGGGAIETISVDGRRHRRLTPREYSGDAAWSPDGGLIAFTRRRRPGGPERVFLVRDDGRSLRPLTRRYSCCPSWSPDGRRLVFIGRPRKNADRNALYVVRRDGTGERRITPAYGMFRKFWIARWSPTRSQILFGRSIPGYVLGLAELNGRIRYLGRGQFDARWSPNGRQIAFTDDCQDGGMGVFVMNADGSGRRAVTPCVPNP